MQDPAAKVPGATFASKKSKAAAKSGGAKRQWQIMLDNGIPASEVERFRSAAVCFRDCLGPQSSCVAGRGAVLVTVLASPHHAVSDRQLDT